MGIIEGIALLIICGLLAAFVSDRLKFPPILGYILSGIIIGPHGVNLISDVETIEILAEMGVIFLLFSIGLDFSFKELKRVKSIALYGTPLQILAVIGMGYGIGIFLKISSPQALVLGTVASLSSTMIVIKILMSQQLMGTLSSRVMIGMLIVQDLAAIPMMILIPQINNIQEGLPLLGFTLLKAALFLIVIVVVGTKIFPHLLRMAARRSSRELFLLTITALGLGVSYVTYLAGLSFAFGAFVAGMVISESEYSHQALSDIIPLRDIFGLLFFSGIGMMFDPSFALQNWYSIAALSLMVLVGKGIILSLISRIFGYVNVVPIAVGLGLAQIGEFSFVLSKLAFKENILSEDVYALILSASIVTMIVSPFLARLTLPLYRLKKKLTRSEDIVECFNIEEEDMQDHIVIAGGGRVGKLLASVLFKLKYNFVIIENSFQYFEQVKERGYPVIFGDASDGEVLLAAGIQKSKLVLITIPNILTAKSIVEHIQNISQEIHIIVRTDSFEGMRILREKKIFEVVLPEFEAGIEIIRQALLHRGVSAAAIQKYTDKIRSDALGRYHNNNDISYIMKNMDKFSYMLDITWTEIEKQDAAVGKNIAELNIRQKSGVSVVGVFRGETFIPNPSADFIFLEKDMVASMGDVQNNEKFLLLIKGKAVA